MQTVFLKKRSNELDMLTVFQSEGQLEEFKETLVEGFRVHLVKLVPFQSGANASDQLLTLCSFEEKLYQSDKDHPKRTLEIRKIANKSSMILQVVQAFPANTGWSALPDDQGEIEHRAKSLFIEQTHLLQKFQMQSAEQLIRQRIFKQQASGKQHDHRGGFCRVMFQLNSLPAELDNVLVRSSHLASHHLRKEQQQESTRVTSNQIFCRLSVCDFFPQVDL